MRKRPTLTKATRVDRTLGGLIKAPTGIVGFDAITAGGLPSGRPRLLCGAAGCGKTLFGMHFLVRGALDYAKSGVFVACEEREEDLIRNVASLGFELPRMIVRQRFRGIRGSSTDQSDAPTSRQRKKAAAGARR